MAVEKTISNRSSRSLTPSHKGCEDLYNEDDSTSLHSLEHLSKMYPMLCYCRPDGPQKPCWCRADGHRGRLPTRRKLLWCSPTLFWQALNWHKAGHQKKFYVDDSPRANLGVLTLFIVLSVLIDAFTDPKMAIWTDECRSKYGRRRPFMVVSAIFVPIVFVLSWAPIVSSGTPAAIWFGIFHICSKLADTVFNIPHEAWGAQLTPLSKERTNCWMWRELFQTFGILMGIAILPMALHDGKQCSSTPDTGCVQMPLIAALLGVVFMVSSLSLACFGKEPTVEYINRAETTETLDDSGATLLIADSRSIEQYSEEDTIPSLLTGYLNRPFRLVLISVFARAAGVNVPFLLLPFITPWVIGEKCFGAGLYTILAAVNLLCGILMIVPWTWLASYIGKVKAYIGFNMALLTTSLLFLAMGYDTGSCAMTYLTIVIVALWGAAYGGSFLEKDVICDAIDYDELLTGGRRREGVYMMAVDFVPKFIQIPGDCIPLLLLAWLNYHRAIPETHMPDCADPPGGLSPDEMCALHYASEPHGAGWCSSSLSCLDLIADGVTFVCNAPEGKCGSVQNDDIVILLRLCISIVPAFFISLGLISLWFYPKEAKTESGHEKLMLAISGVRSGKAVDDPWRTGNQIRPAGTRGPNFGALSYFWPDEIRGLVPSALTDSIDYSKLLLRPLISGVSSVLLVPLGIYIMALGYDDLKEEMGASVTPLGLMVIGVGCLGIWWQGTRARVAMVIKARQVPINEIIQYVNFLSPFEGRPQLSFETSGDSGAKPESAESPREDSKPVPQEIGQTLEKI